VAALLTRAGGPRHGISEKLHALALEAYDRMFGLVLDALSVDDCITKAPCGGEKAGRSPVDRGKQGLKRSVASKARGVPLGLVSAGANRPDSPLLSPTPEATKNQVGAASGQCQRQLGPRLRQRQDPSRARLGRL
jgi:hypothetical protein